MEVADSIVLRENDEYQPKEIINRLGLPVFVKPNLGGSSFATTKVKEPPELAGAIKAFEEAHEVIIERFIEGIEVTCGCYETEKGMVVLPLTEVVTHNEFLITMRNTTGRWKRLHPLASAMT